MCNFVYYKKASDYKFNQKFSLSSLIKRIMQLECKECNQRFKNKNQKDHHHKKVHQNSIKVVYTCPLEEVHIAVDPQSRLASCHRCDTLFKDFPTLQKHATNCNNKKHLGQDICEDITAVENDLNNQEVPVTNMAFLESLDEQQQNALAQFKQQFQENGSESNEDVFDLSSERFFKDIEYELVFEGLSKSLVFDIVNKKNENRLPSIYSYTCALMEDWFSTAHGKIEDIPYDFRRQLTNDSTSEYPSCKPFSCLQSPISLQTYTSSAKEFVCYLLEVSQMEMGYHFLNTAQLKAIKLFTDTVTQHVNETNTSSNLISEVPSIHYQLMANVLHSLFLVKYSLIEHRRNCPVFRYWVYTGLNEDGSYKIPLNMTRTISHLRYLIRLFVVYKFHDDDIVFRQAYFGDVYNL